MTTPQQPSTASQPSTPFEMLGAQLSAAERARVDSNKRLEAILKTMQEQNEQIAQLRQAVEKQAVPAGRSNTVTLALASLIIALIVADYWTRGYIDRTILGDGQRPLWDFINGKEYGMGLSAAEILTVIFSRFFLGFSGTFATVFGLGSLLSVLWRFINKKA